MTTDIAREELTANLHEARTATDALFDLVRPDALYQRPIPERHRIIFYLGHVEAFDWNLICRGALDMPGFSPEMDDLLAFGIDPGSAGLPSDEPSEWPTIEQVRDYNRRVRDAVDRSLGRVPAQLHHVAAEHRWMHAETFAFMLHNLPGDKKIAPPHKPVLTGSTVAPAMAAIPAGTAILGQAKAGGFGWDNEFEQHAVDVSAFRIGKHKITNAEYAGFVAGGGPVPHFWKQGAGGWLFRGMFDEIPLPANWPVYVTHEQAAAYAEWKGKRLPTEPEYHRAAYGSRPGGSTTGSAKQNNFDFHSWDPIPVDSAPANDSGVVQAVGNGWEWTSTAFGPFPGFQPFPFYRGYSANFFDGEHYVLKGASPRTAAVFTRPSFRNWFRPSYPYVYATFRLVED